MKIELHFKSIKLYIFPDGQIMLYRHDGEGMEIGRGQLEKLLNDYYKENF